MSVDKHARPRGQVLTVARAVVVLGTAPRRPADQLRAANPPALPPVLGLLTPPHVSKLSPRVVWDYKTKCVNFLLEKSVALRSSVFSGKEQMQVQTLSPLRSGYHVSSAGKTLQLPSLCDGPSWLLERREF